VDFEGTQAFSPQQLENLFNTPSNLEHLYAINSSIVFLEL
jgi:hypothetical protein